MMTNLKSKFVKNVNLVSIWMPIVVIQEMCKIVFDMKLRLFATLAMMVSIWSRETMVFLTVIQSMSL